MDVKEIRELFPKALRLARENAKLDQNEAARKAGVSKQALIKHEDGKNLPILANFLDELEAYGIDFAAFHEFLLEARTIGRLEKAEQEIKNMRGEITRLNWAVKELQKK